MKKRMALGIVCGIVCALGLQAQVLGKVDYIEGSAEITRNGEKLRAIAIGTPIENLDLVKTSANGLVSIAFEKDSGLTGSIQIVPNSTALIRQDLVSGSPSNEAQLMAGSVNLKVKRLAGMKSAIQVKTPTAVLGVRGTEFSVATFNGSVITACKEGEVSCASYSAISETLSTDGGASAVPGTMVEILESGAVNTGSFPEGNFEDNWKAMRDKWQTYNVDLFAADPVNFMNQFIVNWNDHSAKVESLSATLRANPNLKKWLADAKAGKVSGNLADWAREKPSVMKDLLAVRPDMTVAMISWYRLQELIPLVPQSAMNRTLATGETVKAFIARFNRGSASMASSVALFSAAEKQYMLRNDGLSPFLDF